MHNTILGHYLVITWVLPAFRSELCKEFLNSPYLARSRTMNEYSFNLSNDLPKYKIINYTAKDDDKRIPY